MQADDTTGIQQTHALLEIVKAFAVCEHAIASEELDGPKRLDRLIEAHGILMAACGPGHLIRFEELLGRLTGDRAGSLEGLLPDWIDTRALAGVRLMDSEGVATEDGFDFRHEAQRVMRAAQKVGKFNGQVTKPKLDDEYSQEAVFSAIKGPFYERHRTTLVQNPTVPKGSLSDLKLPSRANDFYKPISQYAQYNGWWWPCPACKWPMKVAATRSGARIQGRVRCLYPWHEETGASYEFVVTARKKSAPTLSPTFGCRVPSGRFAALWTGAVPQLPEAQPVEEYVELVRPVWRYTVVPGLPELALHRAVSADLEGTAWTSHLWPNGDQCDHWITHPDSEKPAFPADFKDYTWVNHLVSKLHMDGGDRGGAEYLVVPDHRQEQVAQLDMVCRMYGLKAAMTATDYVEMVITGVKEGRA
ncbi:restriction endonuclease-related protein [Streptomyces sp. NPDC002285]